MRTSFAVVALVLVAAGGCGMDQKRIEDEREQRFSAARLGGRFHPEDPLVLMLSPGEREAMRRAGMINEDQPPTLDGEGDLAEGDDPSSPLGGETEKSGMDKAGDVMMSVLTVSLTLGMMAAPYLLF